MAIPTINNVAGITADPELRHTPQGTAVLSVRLAFNDSKYNDQTKSWETSKTFYVDGEIWEQAAERNADILRKGDQVYVEGRLETQSWEQDGAKRSKPSLTIRSIRKLEKGQPSTGTQQPRQQAQQPSQQAWGGAQAPAQDPWGTGQQSEVPF
jgi:single-strand DNA-binding protein